MGLQSDVYAFRNCCSVNKLGLRGKDTKALSSTCKALPIVFTYVVQNVLIQELSDISECGVVICGAAESNGTKRIHTDER